MMKKTILLLVAALCGVLTAAAQDLIVKTDATKVEAKVTEITPDAVRYKRFSNPDGPTYVLPVADIDYIRYANGEKERFRAAETVPAVPLTPATPVAAAPAAQAPVQQAAPVQYVAKEYQIGEFYDQNGVKGVVCMLTEDRRHGLIISLDEIYLPWSEFRKPDLRVAGADDRIDGMGNMEKVAAYIAENNLSWDDFPAFKWCRDKGEGWYLPAIDEPSDTTTTAARAYIPTVRPATVSTTRSRITAASAWTVWSTISPRPRRTRRKLIRPIRASNLPM